MRTSTIKHVYLKKKVLVKILDSHPIPIHICVCKYIYMYSKCTYTHDVDEMVNDSIFLPFFAFFFFFYLSASQNVWMLSLTASKRWIPFNFSWLGADTISFPSDDAGCLSPPKEWKRRQSPTWPEDSPSDVEGEQAGRAVKSKPLLFSKHRNYKW